jgi:hypothetical protein
MLLARQGKDSKDAAFFPLSDKMSELTESQPTVSMKV